MKRIILIAILLFGCCVPVRAQTLTAPEPPSQVADLLPEDRDSFPEALWYVIKASVLQLRPDLAQVRSTCLSIVAVAILLGVLQSFDGLSKFACALCGVVTMAALLLKPTHALIALGADTVAQISQYEKLLLPVMTGALAAQGGISASAALYSVTAFVNAVLSAAVSRILVPMVYIYLALSLVSCVCDDAMTGKLRDLIKWAMSWGLKIALYCFTGFISITGVLSGTTDQAALKATKLTISGMVPVVGSILSDASESVLLGAAVVKNAAGIGGLLVILALAIGPFFRIGVQYLLLKVTGAVCEVFCEKKLLSILEHFSSAMGMLLAMTGTLCLMLLISLVCFLKGVG